MIKYIKRKDINTQKYDACIDQSIQSKIYAFSWYLDIVADNWDVLVLDDYSAVMPITWRKKIGIKYVYPPFWLLELGVFSLDESVDYSSFFKIVCNHFKFVETRLNTHNHIQESASFLIDKQMQILSIKEGYKAVFSAYRKDRRKDLRKATNANLTEKWDDDADTLIQLFKDNVGQRTPYIVAKDYDVLRKLIEICIEKGVGEILSVYNTESRLVASGFFLKHKNCVTILVSSTDFKYRKNGENTFLIDRAIFKFQKDYEVFNFGGSSMDSIASYFLSFGAATHNYKQIKYNNLPFLVQLIKS
ncbi:MULTISPECIES: GNAT family N-acetyltransferase [unclassified Polaribacter]|uniref:GNAT family N-acetyltransferase n=1 Tax=unclassified Polaribacter TaxID=196858 RepID=UPI0011BFAD2E|nr:MULTISPECIES: GNAT family N-acetyltransferase [unclassified Polaribacter]TXD54284.1 GNAT family N-acetyltransferase [Polaribacter sp. IC063]TXD62885.1 GNAT family N-acetyltransferase [Polaribacter sp. IC066]